MNGKVFLYNPTISNLTVKINDDTSARAGAHFLAAATPETNWAPRLGAEAVERTAKGGPNLFGYGDNKLYIYPDIEDGQPLVDGPNVPVELVVKIDREKAQLAVNLMLYLFFEDAKYGYVLFNDRGLAMRLERSSRS